MNLTLVGTSRCDVPARKAAGGIVAPLNAARTAQRAVPTWFQGIDPTKPVALLGRRDACPTFYSIVPAQPRLAINIAQFHARNSRMTGRRIRKENSG